MPPASAAQMSPGERAVKATYLTKFASYLDWPSKQLAPGASLVLCVVGPDPFGAALDQAVSGQTIGDHPLVLRRYASASDIARCHIAYLGGSSRDIASALASAGTAPVVTVTDSRNANIAGMIHFQRVGNSVKFDIDANRASHSGLGISSKLLGLARKVRRVDTR